MLVWPKPALSWLPDQAFFMGPWKPGPHHRSTLEAPWGTADHTGAIGVWSGARPPRGLGCRAECMRYPMEGMETLSPPTSPRRGRGRDPHVVSSAGAQAPGPAGGAGGRPPGPTTLSASSDHRFYFKKVSDEFECGVVFEEVREDTAVLPVFEEKIIGKVEKVD